MSEQSMSARESSLETLRDTLTFPCAFEFKVIGTNSSRFVARVVQAGISAVGPAVSPRIATKESSKGSYVSVSMELEVPDPETILEIYAGVQKIDEVKITL